LKADLPINKIEIEYVYGGILKDAVIEKKNSIISERSGEISKLKNWFTNKKRINESEVIKKIICVGKDDVFSLEFNTKLYDEKGNQIKVQNSSG